MMFRSGFAFLGVGLALTAVVTLFGNAPRAGDEVIAEIVFLTCEIAGEAVNLIEWETVPGAMKAPRGTERPGDIHYNALGRSGASLWTGSTKDPRFIRFESPALETVGNWTDVTITHDTATFTLRVPAREDIEQVAFFVIDRASNESAKRATHGFLGSIPWPKSRRGTHR